MHPAIVAMVAAEQRRDQLAQAVAVRRARQARRARRAAAGLDAGTLPRRPQPRSHRYPDLLTRHA